MIPYSRAQIDLEETRKLHSRSTSEVKAAIETFLEPFI